MHNKALADYRLADNQHLTIGRLPINTKSYRNLTFLPFEIEKSCWLWFLHYELQYNLLWRPPIRQAKSGRTKQVVTQWTVAYWDGVLSQY